MHSSFVFVFFLFASTTIMTTIPFYLCVSGGALLGRRPLSEPQHRRGQRRRPARAL